MLPIGRMPSNLKFLCKCHFTWAVWGFFSNLFGWLWVLEIGVEGLVSRWFGGPFKGRCKVTWRLVPSVVSWAIWKEHNGRIFEREMGSIGEVFVKAKWQLIGWLSICKEFTGLSPEDFYLSWVWCTRGGWES